QYYSYKEFLNKKSSKISCGTGVSPVTNSQDSPPVTDSKDGLTRYKFKGRSARYRCKGRAGTPVPQYG
ncbi:MAG: hypothetical protein SAK29_16250, partial [Scytonema sp. PMC 1069.18]|nr:hypothetical protein [Scytonema sp. PMC 1069.18]